MASYFALSSLLVMVGTGKKVNISGTTSVASVFTRLTVDGTVILTKMLVWKYRLFLVCITGNFKECNSKSLGKSLRKKSEVIFEISSKN